MPEAHSGKRPAPAQVATMAKWRQANHANTPRPPTSVRIATTRPNGCRSRSTIQRSWPIASLVMMAVYQRGKRSFIFFRRTPVKRATSRPLGLSRASITPRPPHHAQLAMMATVRPARHPATFHQAMIAPNATRPRDGPSPGLTIQEYRATALPATTAEQPAENPANTC